MNYPIALGHEIRFWLQLRECRDVICKKLKMLNGDFIGKVTFCLQLRSDVTSIISGSRTKHKVRCHTKFKLVI